MYAVFPFKFATGGWKKVNGESSLHSSCTRSSGSGEVVLVVVVVAVVVVVVLVVVDVVVVVVEVVVEVHVGAAVPSPSAFTSAQHPMLYDCIHDPTHCGGVFAVALPRATTNPIGEPSAANEHGVLVQTYFAPRLQPAPIKAPATISVSVHNRPPSFEQSRFAQVQSLLLELWHTMLIFDRTQKSIVSPCVPEDRSWSSQPSSAHVLALRPSFELPSLPMNSYPERLESPTPEPVPASGSGAALLSVAGISSPPLVLEASSLSDVWPQVRELQVFLHHVIMKE